MFRSATGGLDAIGPDDGFGWVGFDEGWCVGCVVDVRGVAGPEARATIRDDDVDTEEQAADRRLDPDSALDRSHLIRPVGTNSHPPNSGRMADIVWQ
jgi:hypothetical protein